MSNAQKLYAEELQGQQSDLTDQVKSIDAEITKNKQVFNALMERRSSLVTRLDSLRHMLALIRTSEPMEYDKVWWDK